MWKKERQCDVSSKEILCLQQQQKKNSDVLIVNYIEKLYRVSF